MYDETCTLGSFIFKIVAGQSVVITFYIAKMMSNPIELLTKINIIKIEITALCIRMFVRAR